MNGEERAVSFITGAKWSDLPSAAQGTLKLALLDTLGAALAGTLAPISDISAACAGKLWPGAESTLLLRGARASAAGAAFANANTANAIDIDDCGLYTKGHPGAQIIPAALAVAEARGASGADMLAAMAVGYEVALRAARIWHATRDVYQACGSWGSVACTAIAAHLMRLTPEQTRHALGIAEYHAPNLPMMRDIDDPTMVKHGIGWGAMNGIISAELAACGYTGIPSLFSFEPYQAWVEDIGQDYLLTEGIAYKRYACCAWIHPAIEAAKRLMPEHGFRAADIARIRLEVFHEAYRLGDRLPTTAEEAQFNMVWPLAAYILDGEVGPDQMLAHRFGDPAVRDLMSRIELVETEELNRLFALASVGDPAGRFACRVKFELHDGRALDSGLVEGEINFPQTTWDAAGLERKFRWLAARVLDADRIDALVNLIARFEEVENVSALTRLITEPAQEALTHAK